VAVVVESSLRRRDEGVRLAARALDVKDGFQIWGERAEGPSGGLFAMNDRLACALGDALSTTMRSEGRCALPDPRALERYVAARHALRLAWTRTAPLAPVVAQFDEALALAPEDPLILAGAAMARARARNFESGRADDGPHAAQALARRAQALAPDAAEPRLALASIAFADCAWTEAVHELRAALVRAPALAHAHAMLATIQGEIGAVDDALARFSTAMTLDASLTQARAAAARLHALEGRWSYLEAQYDTSRAESADGASLALFAARMNLWCGERRFSFENEGFSGISPTWWTPSRARSRGRRSRSIRSSTRSGARVAARASVTRSCSSPSSSRRRRVSTRGPRTHSSMRRATGSSIRRGSIAALHSHRSASVRHSPRRVGSLSRASPRCAMRSRARSTEVARVPRAVSGLRYGALGRKRASARSTKAASAGCARA